MRFDDPHLAPEDDEETPVEDRTPTPDDDALRAVVTRLARPHQSGGRVVERAALMAAGTDFNALLSWIESHDGVPEAPASKPDPRASTGLFGDQRSEGPQQPLRFVLPATAFA